jgi:hypothetical protein
MASQINASAQSLTNRLSAILSLLRQILGTHDHSRSLAPTLKWAIWHRLIFFRPLILVPRRQSPKIPLPRRHSERFKTIHGTGAAKFRNGSERERNNSYV